MKKITNFLVILFSSFIFSQQQNITGLALSPNSFEENQSITITISGNTINESAWGIPDNAIYLWAWSFDLSLANIQDCPTNGTWTSSSETNRFNYNAATDSYSISFVPSTFYSRTNIGRIGFLIKAKNGTGDKKSQDFTFNVGSFQATLTAPVENSTSILTSGSNLTVTATNTNGNANYVLLANGTAVNNQNNISSYSFTVNNITTNQSFDLQVTQGMTIKSKKFFVVVNPGTISQALPAGLKLGINYNNNDATKATLVLNAPNKDFVYVAGTFNNWNPNTNYAMKKDPSTGKFWIEITGLTSGTNYSYQYWVGDETPVANSPKLVKIADPCSTLVLSPFDDSSIPSTSFPNIPAYPVGQEREVTWLKTGQTPYNWQVANFVKPSKDKLVIYELLIRDFDANRNYQDVINKISYFKNLGINAIQLMPVMEFEGNESWGYNTAFHMALDKFYGTPEKFKELVDICHQNGIAIILDIAFNHAFGRNPLVRMYMNDTDNDGWGSPSTENVYFNTVARHSYNVGEDFNHSTVHTKEYVKRTLEYWISEFKIDGYRWDLTKGFTQNCTAADENCTNGSQPDRIAILKEYVDYTWGLDPTHYAIFEHLGSDSEEQQWANYRVSGESDGISKGVMMWGEMFGSYNEIMKGFSAGGDISRILHTAHGFTAKRLIGYPESHDKDRIAYNAFANGNTGGVAPIGGNLNNIINRQSALGAISLLIPGPKMIWHFQELGMADSIYTCSNGSINTPNDAISGDCKLATKPQPQWVNDWLTTAPRNAVYSNYSKIIKLKTLEPVFNGTCSISPDDNNNVKQRIYINDNSLFGLNKVVILANLSVSNSIGITPDFPNTGTWYNLMDGTTLNVSNTSADLLLNSGEFRIYGNQPANMLANEQFVQENLFDIFPNPAKGSFSITTDAKMVEIINVSGQLVSTIYHVAAHEKLDISKLNTGIYFVKVYGDKAFSVNKLFVE